MPDSQDGGTKTPGNTGAAASSGPQSAQKPSEAKDNAEHKATASTAPIGSGDGRRRRRRRRGRRRKKAATETGQNPATANDVSESPAPATSEKKPPGPHQGKKPRNQGGKPRGKGLRRPRTRPARGRFAHTYGALDLGTNNCRLLIARPQESGFKIIDAFSRTVRLGQGISTDENGAGALTDDAMDRAIDALGVCADKMRRRGVTRARCIATEACRTAVNGEEFVAKVADKTGLALEVISPEREATLAVSGCAPLLDTKCDAAMVFDIGGGSTELVWLDLKPMREEGGEPEILTWTSLPFGVVTLAETYLDSKPENKEQEFELFNNLVGRVQREIEGFTGADGQRALYDTKQAHLIGNSGTVTTLAAVHLGLRAYDRRKVDGLWIDGGNLYDLVGKLSTMGFDGRAAIPSVGLDRADLLFPGCAILRAIQDTWPSDRVRVADRGLREGILVELMDQAEREARRRRSRRGRRGGRKRKPGANKNGAGAAKPTGDAQSPQN